jgi:nicotinamide mononucleotide (NMN) deamidase PncC
MQDLLPAAQKLGALLKDRHETIAIAESSTGGLISAALLSVPGASAYFIGGAVVYTLKARRAMLARAARDRFAVTWSAAEIGASGPTGNRYGDPAGHSCIAVAGPIERSMTVETGSADRLANMRAFAAAALDLLTQCVAAAPRRPS